MFPIFRSTMSRKEFLKRSPRTNTKHAASKKKYNAERERIRRKMAKVSRRINRRRKS
jgi:hypothetical protein